MAAATAAARSPAAGPHTAHDSTANAQDRGSAASSASSGSGSGAPPAAAAAADVKPLARRPTLSSGGAAAAAGGEASGYLGEVLDSIAEPSQAAEGDEDDSVTPGSGAGPGSSRGVSAGSGISAPATGTSPQKGGKTKQGGKQKKKSKKPVKLVAAMVEAQTQASAALKLLALSGDAARRSLLEAGVLPVLLPLLEGTLSQARWNARQVRVEVAKQSAGATCSRRLERRRILQRPCGVTRCTVTMTLLLGGWWQGSVDP